MNMLKIEHFFANDKSRAVVTDIHDDGETTYFMEFFVKHHCYSIWIYLIIDNAQLVLYEISPDIFLLLCERLETKIPSTQLEAYPNQTTYYDDGRSHLYTK